MEEERHSKSMHHHFPYMMQGMVMDPNITYPHMSCPGMMNQNTDISTVSKRLAHARTSTTMDIYSHSLQKGDILASDKLENLFNKKSKNVEQGL